MKLKPCTKKRLATLISLFFIIIIGLNHLIYNLKPFGNPKNEINFDKYKSIIHTGYNNFETKLYISVKQKDTNFNTFQYSSRVKNFADKNKVYLFISEYSLAPVESILEISAKFNNEPAEIKTKYYERCLLDKLHISKPKLGELNCYQRKEYYVEKLFPLLENGTYFYNSTDFYINDTSLYPRDVIFLDQDFIFEIINATETDSRKPLFFNSFYTVALSFPFHLPVAINSNTKNTRVYFEFEKINQNYRVNKEFSGWYGTYLPDVIDFIPLKDGYINLPIEGQEKSVSGNIFISKLDVTKDNQPHNLVVMLMPIYQVFYTPILIFILTVIMNYNFLRTLYLSEKIILIYLAIFAALGLNSIFDQNIWNVINQLNYFYNTFYFLFVLFFPTIYTYFFSVLVEHERKIYLPRLKKLLEPWKN